MHPAVRSSWQRFCPSAELAEGRARALRVGEFSVAVARWGGRLSAFGALCPHKQADLSQGRLEAGALTCADHLWRFDLSTGACTNVPGARVPVYAVREEAGWIDVALPVS